MAGTVIRTWRGRGFRCCRASRGSALEVCGVPATAFELEASRTELLGVSLAAAGRTSLDWRVTMFLKVILRVAAVATMVFVYGHFILLSR